MKKANKRDDTKKKYFIIGIAIVLIIVIILLLLSSCGKGLEVEFNVDGNVYLTQKLHKGDKLEDIEEPKKKGYTFDGWYLDGEKYPLDKPIEENISLEAVFTKNKYTVTFNDESGEEEKSQTIEYGDKVTKPEEPIKEDYAFLGWFSGDTEYDFNEPVTGDLNLTPKWVKNKASYTVEHYLMGLDGKYSDKAYKKEKFKGTIGKTVKPAVKSFKGFTSPSIKVIEGLEDNKLIIKYYYERNKYDVTITGDKGILEVTGSGKYYYGEDVKISAVVKDGYTFKKWSNGTKNLTFTYNVSDNNAKFEALTNVNTYDISYELNGGTLNNKNNSYTVEDEITFEIPSKLGYTFTGWLLDGKEFDGTIKAGTTGDLNVEATFKPNENTKYVIQCYLMDTTGENYILDETRTLNKTGITDTKIEYTPEDIEGFAKPVLKDQYNQEVDLEDLVIEADESTILKYYYERNKYDLTINFVNTLDPNDTEGVKSITSSGSHYYGEDVDVNIELLDGFDFVKWSNDDTNTSTSYEMTATNNQTLTASIKRHTYTVSFDSQGGSNVDSIEVLYGKNITKPTNPTLEGYDFDTWYSDKELNNEWNFDDDTMPASDITLYAKWTIRKSSVVFDANTGTFGDNKNKVVVENQTYGSTISELQTPPTKEGYNFAGWYKTVDGTDKWDFENDTMPSDALTLYAHWTPITFTIHFEGNTNTSGSMSDLECTYDQDCILNTNEFVKQYTVNYDDNDTSSILRVLSNSQTVKYNFVEWKNGNDSYKNEDNVKNLTSTDKETINLTAQWKIDENTAELKEVSRTGYDFDGWFKGETEVENLNDLEENLDLQAHWTAITYTIVFDGNGGETSDGKTQVEVTATYDKALESIETFTNSLTLTYDYNNGSEGKTESKNAPFKDWDYNGKTYIDPFDIVNLTSTSGDKITLEAEWIYPEIQLENPSKSSTEDYYTYEFKDWTDGEEDYQSYQQSKKTLTLTEDLSLDAEYLKVIDTEKYIKEKMITSSRTGDLTTSIDGEKDNAYNIDIVNVNGDIVNDNDIKKIEAILKNADGSKNEDVVDVVLASGDENVDIKDSSSVKNSIDILLSNITANTTPDKVESDKHLSSLYGKTISLTVNFDEEFAKTTDNETSVTYDLTYTNENEKIITQEILEDLSDKGIREVNKENKIHYRIKRNGSNIVAKYMEEDADVTMACVFSQKASILCWGYSNFGHTGMQEAIKQYFTSSQIASFELLDTNKQTITTINSSITDMADEELLKFAVDVLYSMGVVKVKGTGNLLGDAFAIVGITGNSLNGKTASIRVNLSDGYVFADGVDGIFNVKIVDPNTYDTSEEYSSWIEPK